MDIFLAIVLGLFFVWGPMALIRSTRFPRAKPFTCRLGWHAWARHWVHQSHDGCSAHVRCSWCEYEGMVDSQGNLF